MDNAQLTPADESRRRMAERIAEAAAHLPTTCTKYEFVNALAALDPALLENVRAAYAANTDLQFFWNTVQELDRDNADFQRFAALLDATDAQLDEIFRKVKEMR